VIEEEEESEEVFGCFQGGRGRRKRRFMRRGMARD